MWWNGGLILILSELDMYQVYNTLFSSHPINLSGRESHKRGIALSFALLGSCQGVKSAVVKSPP